MPTLAPSRRFLWAFLGWTLLFLAGPGVLVVDGSALMAILGIAAWGVAVIREADLDAKGTPRRWRARLAEGLPALLGSAGFMAWIVYVTPGGIWAIAGSHVLYALFAGWLVRRWMRFLESRARGVSLGAGPVIGIVWWSVEILREETLGRVGLVWMQLGDHAHHHAWLAGSARVFGPEGLTLVLALCGGFLASLYVLGKPRAIAVSIPLGAVLLATCASFLTSPPEMQEGPRVLLVQPGFEQERKQFDDPWENFKSSKELTLSSIAALSEPVDLVCWGETMLHLSLTEGLEEALEKGIQAPPWEEAWDADLIRGLRRVEDTLVRRGLLDQLPPGTAFVTGAEVFAVRGEPAAIRRLNAVVLYDEEGERLPAAPKRHLVPAAETMLGFERYEPVRDLAFRTAGYIPGFYAEERSHVLSFEDRDGREHRFGVSVCFDNAYMDPYSEPAGEGELDFHLVFSNEAWYQDSFEYDQMIAFSRLIAIATGRSVVRATNSGISIVLGPDGGELDRVRAGGRDRGVAGSLALSVPVPLDRRSRTAYVAWGRDFLRLAALVSLVAAFLGGRASRGRSSNGNLDAPSG